jgi:hypothetical protein
LTAHIIEKYNAAIAIHLNIWQSIVFFWEGGGDFIADYDGSASSSFNWIDSSLEIQIICY